MEARDEDRLHDLQQTGRIAVEHLANCLRVGGQPAHRRLLQRAVTFIAAIVIDAVAGISERTEDAALRRIAQAGASTVSVATLSGELAGDFSQPRAQQAIGILFEMVGGE